MQSTARSAQALTGPPALVLPSLSESMPSGAGLFGLQPSQYPMVGALLRCTTKPVGPGSVLAAVHTVSRVPGRVGARQVGKWPTTPGYAEDPSGAVPRSIVERWQSLGPSTSFASVAVPTRRTMKQQAQRHIETIDFM